MPEKEIQGTPAPLDTKSWLEYSWKLMQDIPNRFEDAAKFLATIISVSLTIILTAIDKLKVSLIHPNSDEPKPKRNISTDYTDFHRLKTISSV